MAIRIPTPQDVSQKTVLMRVDFNVSFREEGGTRVIADDRRIKNALETLRFLSENQAKVVLVSHLGRPEASFTLGGSNVISTTDQKFSLKSVAEHLSGLLGAPVQFIPDCAGPSRDAAVQALQPGQVALCENLRCYAQEKAGDPVFAAALAKKCDVYINEAFSNSHRAHTSMAAVTQLLPSFGGLSLAKEVEKLSKLVENPERPLVIVIGGAKISDKVSVIEHLANVGNLVLVGGGVANNFLKAEGIEIHKSYLQDIPADLKQNGVNYVEFAKRLIEEHKHERILKDGYLPLPKILYPVDVVAAPTMDSPASETQIIDLTHDMRDTDTDKDLMYLDIGPTTRKLYSELLLQAKTIFWSGPMGVFEKSPFTTGTQEVGKAVADSAGYSVAGGGDTITAIDTFKLEGGFDYISTAGGAALDLLAGKQLPGLVPITSTN